MQTLKKMRIAMAILAVVSGSAAAQTYTKTESITYHNNTSKWILGQAATVTDVSTGLVQSSTTYDSTYAMPTTRSEFGALRQTLTYDTTSSLASGLLGTLSTVKDGNNNTTSLSSWKRGIPRTIQHPDTYSQSAVVNDAGWVESVTDENTYSTSYGHDAMGRISLITYPTGDTTTWTNTTRSVLPIATAEYGIPAGHWRETVTTGNAVKITYFDGMWRPLLVREYDSANQAGTERFVRQQYDERGRLAFKSYPSTTSSPTTGVWSDYDPLGRVESISQDSELGLLSTTTTYNTGFTTTVTNPRSQATTTAYMTYDQPSTDWPVTITAPESATTTIGRDVFGKPNSIMRSGGGASATRTYAYNARQELCRTVESETGATLFGYDNAGNLVWSAAGMASGTACPAIGTTTAAIDLRKISRTYDNRNRLLTLSFPDGKGNQIWTYYNDGLPKQITTYNATANGEPVINAYTYNKRRMLTGESVQQPGWYAWALGYGYNALGHVVTQSYPTGLVVTNTTNALGQVTQVTSPGVTYASGASYYPNGAIKQFTYGNGIVHTMTQNARQLPLRSTDTGTSDYEYVYDANGNVGTIYDQLRGAYYGRWMQYDNLDRLTAVGSASFLGSDDWHRFTYDTLDNLKSWKLAGVKDYATYTYTNNRLTSIQNTVGSSVVALDYDVQGNLTNKNGQGYVFDYGNRLRSATGKEAYRYDAQGRRVQTSNNDGSQQLFKYSMGGQYMFRWKKTPTNVETTEENVYLAGSLITTIEHAWPSNAIIATKFQHTDALGSPVAVTNTSGVVIDRTDWEPYGAAIGKPTYNGMGYTGHVMDGATGLTYMQQRYYDPQIGRFLSVDPVSADPNNGALFNRYMYAANNPYRFFDPDGRCTGSRIANSDGTCASTGGFTTQSGPAGGTWTNGVHRQPTFGEALKANFDRNVDRSILGPGGKKAMHFLGDEIVEGMGNIADGKFKSASINLAMGLAFNKLGPLGNKLQHIFGKESHLLGGLLAQFGGDQRAAFSAVQLAANRELAAGRLVVGPNGVLPDAGNVVNVQGVLIQLSGGRVMDDTVKIGSFSSVIRLNNE